MSSVLAAAAAAKIQEIRAQSLATMLSIVEASAQAGQAGTRPSGMGAATAESAPIRAILVEMQGNSRALVQLPGGYAEVELPPALLRQFAANPAVLKPGVLLLLPADIPARPVPGPATALGVPATPPVQLPAQPTGNFPPGSLGAALSRMTGIALPMAEPAPAQPMMATARVPAAAVPAALVAPLPAAAPLRATPLPPGLSAALAEAALQGATRQLPLATVMTGLLARLFTPPDEAHQLPPGLQGMLDSLRSLRNTPAALASPQGLKQALQQSGLFLENQLSRPAAVATPTIAPDLKAMLLNIRETADHSRQALRGEPGLAAEIGRLAEGGAERIKLMQLASLPGHAEWVRSDDPNQGLRLAMSIPLAPHGPDRPQTAVMGVMIEHQPEAMPEPDDATSRESQGEAQPFPWKVRIALDLEETGPVEAEIGLRGQSVSVQLWAEQPGMVKLARAAIGDLHAALSGAAFEIVRLDVHEGRSTPRLTLPSPYLDRRT